MRKRADPAGLIAGGMTPEQATAYLRRTQEWGTLTVRAGTLDLLRDLAERESTAARPVAMHDVATRAIMEYAERRPERGAKP